MMVSIPTPIPKSLSDRLRSFARSRWTLQVYRLVLLVLIGGLVVALASTGGVLGVIGGVVVFVFLAESVRESTSDIWNARFSAIDVDLSWIPGRD